MSAPPADMVYLYLLDNADPSQQWQGVDWFGSDYDDDFSGQGVELSPLSVAKHFLTGLVRGDKPGTNQRDPHAGYWWVVMQDGRYNWGQYGMGTTVTIATGPGSFEYLHNEEYRPGQLRGRPILQSLQQHGL